VSWCDDEKGDGFISFNPPFVSGRPAREAVKHSGPSQLFNLENEHVCASQLMELYGSAKELELMFGDAARDKLAVLLLPLFGGEVPAQEGLDRDRATDNR
jgi:hypothetical protein